MCIQKRGFLQYYCKLCDHSLATLGGNCKVSQQRRNMISWLNRRVDSSRRKNNQNFEKHRQPSLLSLASFRSFRLCLQPNFFATVAEKKKKKMAETLATTKHHIQTTHPFLSDLVSTTTDSLTHWLTARWRRRQESSNSIQLNPRWMKMIHLVELWLLTMVYVFMDDCLFWKYE
jgi:hypothetical protein